MSAQTRPIHSDPFLVRLQITEVLAALAQNKTPAVGLREAADAADSMSLELSSSAAAQAYGALGSLLRIVDSLVLWREAVLDAGLDADRYFRSAQERLKLWIAEYSAGPQGQNFTKAVEALRAIGDVSEVPAVAGVLAATPLPIGIFRKAARPTWAPERIEGAPKREEPVELTVAFLKFLIDGSPASQIHNVTPAEVHDLEIEVRVSRWPVEDSQLQLTPVSVEPRSTFDFPTFVFERPAGAPPFTVQQKGRAALLLPQGMHARPFEFKYTAEFLPEKREQPVAVVGHRTLMIEGAQVEKFQVCGYPSLDNKLFEIRDRLRQRAGVAQNEVADALLILAPLCNLAGRAVQDSEFAGHWTEARFQTHVRAELRRHPLIGVHLDEHAHAAGGITDLSLRGMPIELKVQHSAISSVDDCKAFFAQTIAYATAKSKRTAVLCVLDSADTRRQALPPEVLLDLRYDAESRVAVCVLAIQGNLPLPSSLSR